MRAEARRVRPQDWPAWKGIRLEALADTPIGFLELYADALGRTDAQWRERTEEASRGGHQALWLAWVDDRVVGCTGGWRRDGGSAVGVFAVYVSPVVRGGELFDLLLGAVEDWARTLPGVTELRLEVHEDNARARAAYSKRGFVETGLTEPYPPDPSRRELEMVRPL